MLFPNSSPNYGIGTDIVEISRITAALDRFGERFLERILTPSERLLFVNDTRLSVRVAGRFAAKEACAKALGTGIGKELGWQDLEILPNIYGKPEVRLSSKAHTRFDSPLLLLSISHCKEYAVATALLYSGMKG